MKPNIIISILTALLPTVLCHGGPYPPAAGQPDTTAIPMADPNFVAWADAVVEMIVGEDADTIDYPASKALGPAVGGSFDVACLGRGGKITLNFSCGIGDKPGYDFAVFENAANDTFLELGWVEVSSNGTDFFRFRNHSLTSAPVSTYGSLDTTDISGLAGKYRNGFGTPFDLAELRDVSPLLDVDDVNSVRIVDIVGDGNSLDTNGNPIYDPYKTWGTAGFDLDAIGVINTRSGDIDEDGKVDTDDLVIFLEAWLTIPGDTKWDDRCNVAWPVNNLIDLNDFAVFASQWFIGVQIE